MHGVGSACRWSQLVRLDFSVQVHLEQKHRQEQFLPSSWLTLPCCGNLIANLMPNLGHKDVKRHKNLSPFTQLVSSWGYSNHSPYRVATMCTTAPWNLGSLQPSSSSTFQGQLPPSGTPLLEGVICKGKRRGVCLDLKRNRDTKNIRHTL